MSTHYFDTVHNDHPITVNLGWDRQLSYFFMVILRPVELLDATQADEADFYLYSNLLESNAFGKNLDYYRTVLNNFGIVVPESMFIETLHDSLNNVGNRVVTHQADGSFTESSK